MENIQYAEELVREYLVFRGFTSTLQTFEKELGTDIGKGFQVDKILDLIFSVYVPKFQVENLIGLLNFFKQCFSSSETVLTTTLSKLEVSIIRYYIIHCLQSGRTDKVMEFFEMNGNDLLQKNQDWASWFSGSLLPCLGCFMSFLILANLTLDVSCSNPISQEPELGSLLSCILFKGVVWCLATFHQEFFEWDV